MKFPQYKDTKDSGAPWIGRYPSHWTVERAHFRLTSKRRSISPLEMADRHVIHYSIPNVQQYGTGILEKGEDIDSAKTQLFAPTLLVSKLNPHKTTVCLAEPSDGYITVASGEFVPIESEQIDLTYAKYVWSSSKVRDRLITLTQSVTRSHQRVSPEDIVKLEWAWPTLLEQRSIANFLNRGTAHIDALIEKKRRLLELLEEKRLAILTQAVTKGLDPDVPMKHSGVSELGMIPEHWTVDRLDSLVDPYRPIIYGIVLPGPHMDDGVPIIKGGDIRPERLRKDRLSRTSLELDAKHARSRVRWGDIVYSIRGSFGDVEVVPHELEGANLTQDSARIAPRDNISRDWLLFALKSEPLRQQLGARSLGATIRGVNIRDLRRALLPVPPSEEQKRLASLLNGKVDLLGAAIQMVLRHINLLTEYRSALITNAVTGKIDVRTVVEDEAAA